jgi:transcriptional regulator with AAA-type ATPase domain
MSAPSSTTWSRERVSRGARAPVPEPLLFRVLSTDHLLAAPSRHRLGDIDRVIIGRGREEGAKASRSVDDGIRTLTLRLPDRWMSSAHVTLERVIGRWFLSDAASKNGTWLNGAPVERAVLADGDLLELGQTFFRFRTSFPVGDDDTLDWEAVPEAAPAPLLLTLLPALAGDFARLVEVSRSGVSIVLHGESGAGKEVAARAVHTLSGRRGEFVAVNCGALNETLLESEFFGYRKGAFSGAVEDRPGLVRAADGGTLFLDEIGELPPRSQAKLLRVLQEREVLAVGATRPVRVDLRVVAATQRPLPMLVEAGEFRADLYARLSGFQLRLPPLAERREDLGLLVGALLRRLDAPRADRLRLTHDAARALLAYDWPLNVRELEQCLSAALALAGTKPIGLEHLPEPLRAERPNAGAARAKTAPSDEERQRRDQLLALLGEHKGNISAVARAMGKARLQIQRWIKRYGLDPTMFRR